MPLISSVNTATGVLLVGVLVAGYVALALIWWFGFRGRGDE